MKFDFLEHEAKRLLMERLDSNLLEHARLLNMADGPSIGLVYHLQAMSEIHCYLKTCHEFNAAEVDALLQFADPLAVSLACWEDNPHEYSFPICELLDTVNAHERFPKIEPAQTPEKASVRDRLRAALKEVNRQTPPQAQSRGDDPR